MRDIRRSRSGRQNHSLILQRNVALRDRCAAVLVRHDATSRLVRAIYSIAEKLVHLLAAGRKAYLHVARGSLQANGYALAAGDALMYEDEAAVELSAAKEAEVLFV